MRLIRWLSVLVALVAALWGVSTALAHAHYVSSDPGNGATVATPPTSVTVTFDDDLDPAATTITVLGPSGQTVSAGQTQISTSAPKVATVAISPAGDGTYTVKWHAVSDDDKAVTEGTFTFAVGSGGTANQVAPATGRGAGSAGVVLLTAVGGLAALALGALARHSRRGAAS